MAGAQQGHPTLASSNGARGLFFGGLNGLYLLLLLLLLDDCPTLLFRQLEKSLRRIDQGDPRGPVRKPTRNVEVQLRPLSIMFRIAAPPGWCATRQTQSAAMRSATEELSCRVLRQLFRAAGGVAEALRCVEPGSVRWYD